MRTKRARILLGTIVAAVALSLAPASASAPTMMCSPDVEAVCVVIGTTCNVLDAVDAKILKKDLINCQLG